MKSKNYLSIILLFLVFACAEDGLFFPESESEGTFQVTIDAVLFSTDDVSFTSDGVDIFINAVNSRTKESFTLKVDDFKVGDFSFEGANNIASYIINTAEWTTFNSISSRGSIQFTEIDFVKNTVSGTFSFIGKNNDTGNAIAFSNGSFNKVPKSLLPF